MQRSKEIEFDAVADGGKVLAYAISEHIEFAGVHSGDATMQFPPQKIYGVTAARIRKIATKIAHELRITGPFNIQFLATHGYVKVIECNLRASRSFPFVSKILKVNFIELATKCMLGQHPARPEFDAFDLDFVGVKASQFSYSRLNLADPVPGVDMSSTGEVGCIGDCFDEALLKAMISVGYNIPKKGDAILVSSGNAYEKAEMLRACTMLFEKGYKIYATSGTCKYLVENGVPALPALWPSEGTQPGVETALDLIKWHEVSLVINIPKNYTEREITNGYKLRRAAIDYNIPLITNSRLATAYTRAFCALSEEDLLIKSWDEYKV